MKCNQRLLACRSAFACALAVFGLLGAFSPKPRSHASKRAGRGGRIPLASLSLFALLVALLVPTACSAQKEGEKAPAVNPVPFITEILPVSTQPGIGSKGAGSDLTLTAMGTGFINGTSAIYWNGKALPNPTTCTAAKPPVQASCTVVVPAALIAASGTANITVVNPNTSPKVGASNIVYFPIALSVPQVNAVTTDYGTGTCPGPVAVGDFNGDGNLDVAVAAWCSDDLTILLGDGTGKFTEAASRPPAGTSPGSIAVGDFNGDGKPDLAVGNDGGLTVLLGNGDGTFTPATSSPGAGPGTVVTGDFNADGNLDLAVVNSSGAVTILLGNGDGTFTSTSTASPASPCDYGESPTSIAVGDFNGDGNLDLAVGTEVSGNVSVTILLGDGQGNFTTLPPMTSNIAGWPQWLSAADFNGDGKLDLAIAWVWSSGFAEVNAGERTLLGNGDGTFTVASDNNLVGEDPQEEGLVVADLNGDGKLDVAAAASWPADSWTGFAAILLGDGTGKFQANPNTLLAGWAPTGIGVGDFNGDGRLDLVVADVNANSVAVLLQAPLTPSPTALTFAGQIVGTTSAPQRVTLTNSQGMAFSISIAITGTESGDFAEGNNCPVSPSTLAANGTCTINVTFTPTAAGARSAAVTITDHATGSTQSVTLSGTGTLAGPDLTISKTHTGTFIPGQNGAVYTICVSNVGVTLPSSGTVTVADTLPAALTATAMSGTGWTCTVATLTCTRNDALNAGSSYSRITLTVNVADSAPFMVTNTATVSGGGDVNLSNNTATDPTTVNGILNLATGLDCSNNLITTGATNDCHWRETPPGAATVPAQTVYPGNADWQFALDNGPNSTWIAVNANGGGYGNSGSFSLTFDLSGYDLSTVSLSGLWTAYWDGILGLNGNEIAGLTDGGSLFNSFAVGAGSSFLYEGLNTLTITNSSAPHAGGVRLEGTLTGILLGPYLTISKTHTGNFTPGQTGATYTIGVSNVGTLASSGAVTVADTLPTGLTATAMSGSEWDCSNNSFPVVGNGSATVSCTRSDALAVGSAYPALTLTVNVAANAPYSVTNTAAVQWSTFSNTASDPTTISGPPSADSVSPTPASGSSQTFTLQYSSHNGKPYTDLNNVYVRINRTNNEVNACHVVYFQATNTLYLANDADTAALGPLTAGTPGTLSNSQCTVNGTGTSASGSNQTLTLTLSVSATATLVGTQNIYMAAVDSEGSSSGWQNLGTWTPAADTAPTADSVSPSPASGPTQTFTAKYSTHNGRPFTDLSRVYVEFNTSNNHVNGCEVEYYAPGNALYLKNDLGTAWQGPLAAGTAGTLANGQCTVNGAGTTASGSGPTLTLKLSVSATATFVGTQNMYMSVVDSQGSNSGWVNRGTWTPAADTPPIVDSVSPTPASGTSQTFTAMYSTQNGKLYTDLSKVLVEFTTSTPPALNACEVEYYQPTNSLYLHDDTTTGWQGPLVAGTAGTLSNSQCTVNGAGSMASGSGPTLTLTLSVSATAAFTGAQNIYLAVVDSEGSSSGWQNKGTWTPSP
ncbi:MAG: FG-GAP-like repeat-containing protein [Terriglobia bacterium]